MLKITKITDDPYQRQTFILPDGSQVVITMKYVPLQYCWIITELTYGDFTLKGFRITNGPNLLYQYSEILPFGLCCITDGKREPSQLEDFSSGASNLYFLTETEVQEYEDYLNGI